MKMKEMLKHLMVHLMGNLSLDHPQILIKILLLKITLRLFKNIKVTVINITNSICKSISIELLIHKNFLKFIFRVCTRKTY